MIRTSFSLLCVFACAHERHDFVGCHDAHLWAVLGGGRDDGGGEGEGAGKGSGAGAGGCPRGCI